MTDRHTKIYDSIILMLINIICMAVSLYLAAVLRFGSAYNTGKFDFQSVFIQMMVLNIIENFIFSFHHHFYRRSVIEEISAVIKEEFIFAAFMLVWLYLIHEASNLSRLVFGLYVAFDSVILVFVHLIYRSFMEKVIKYSSTSNRLLILTTLEKAGEIIDNILARNEWYRTIVGVALLDEGFSLDVGKEGCPVYAEGITVVADSGTFMDYALHGEVDEVLIMDDGRRYSGKTLPWARELEEMGVAVHFNIDQFDLQIGGRKKLDRVGKYAVVTFMRNELTAEQMAAKRFLDIAGALVGCVILFIVSLVVVPAIKIDSPGPAIFKQKRVGRNGRMFTLYKFRSMYIDAEERKAQLMDQNEMNGLMFKIEDDPRVTKVGRFIRKTSIDELPQFLNVLKGDMSLVGTRPPTVDEYRQYEARHKARISMTPGITGMWQVSGRSGIKDFDDVVRLDMEYIDNWSIIKDIKILFKTVGVVISGSGSS